MIRVVICDSDKGEARRLRLVVEAFARGTALFNIEPAITTTARELIALLGRYRPGFFDIVLFRAETLGANPPAELVNTTLREIAADAGASTLVLASSNPDLALCAYKTGTEFLEIPYDQERFLNVVGKAIDAVRAEQRKSFTVKSPRGIVNMNADDITFVEANKKGPIIHLPGGSTVSTRGTLQALTERLVNVDERFVRAGGSFIVNLDNVRTAGESSLIFGDGEAIILPVRARKPVREALQKLVLRTA